MDSSTSLNNQFHLLHFIKSDIRYAYESLRYSKRKLGNVPHIALLLSINKFKSVMGYFQSDDVTYSIIQLWLYDPEGNYLDM